jgi:hypothetical protein
MDLKVIWGRTDRPTDRPTNIVSYRGACMRLKIVASSSAILKRSKIPIPKAASTRLKDRVTRSRTFHANNKIRSLNTKKSFKKEKKASSGCQGPWQAVAMDSLKSLKIFQSNIVCLHSHVRRDAKGKRQ